jgi:hypothetical protein
MIKNPLLSRNVQLLFPRGSRDINQAKRRFDRSEVNRVRLECRCSTEVALAILVLEERPKV